MITTVELLVILGITWACAYKRVSKWVWAPLLFAVLLAWSIFGQATIFTKIIVWAIYILPTAIAFLSPLRHRIVTKPILSFFQKALPPMSQTEKEALDAGDVWWEGELFSGNPQWKNLLSLPVPTLTQEEQRFLDNQVETLCQMLDDWKIMQEDKDLPEDVWNYLKHERFFGMAVPKEYGGLDFSALAHSTVVTKIASRSISAAVTTMVPNSLGPAELIHRYGTDLQKQHYLPRLANGSEIPCFGLTSPEAGSDAAAMLDSGVVCRGEFEGKDVLGIKLNFNKRYITLAPIATVLGLAFKLYDPNKLLSTTESLGITVCLVPTDHPGVTAGQRHLPMNQAFMNGPIRGKDVFIPMDWIIGGTNMVGQGWRMLMECLSIGRSISLPALSKASAEVSYRATSAYSLVRKQFKTSIAHFEGIEEGLAVIAGNTYLLEACRVLTTHGVDLGKKPSVVSAIAKYHMTELSRQVVECAMDIHAGRAVQMGPMNYMSNAYFGAPIAITVEGANILTRNLIIFGQGAIRCHPFIRKEMDAVKILDKRHRLQQFDKLLSSHIGYSISNFFKAFGLGLFGGIFAKSPKKDFTKNYYKQLTRMSAALALVSDIAMLMLGGELKRRERLSARLGDVLSELYLSSSVLKYFQDQGENQEERIYVQWVLQNSLYKIQTAFYEFLNNFPNRLLGKSLKFIIFPYGQSYRKPSDKLSHQMVTEMLKPSALRDRIAKNCFIGQDDSAPLYIMELAFNKVVQAIPANKKLAKALKAGKLAQGDLTARCQQALKLNIITEEEMEQILNADKAVNQAIQVDEFSSEELTGKSTSCHKTVSTAAA